MTTPYTYLIYCIPTKEVYYGARWAKNCNPDDLWKTYFTSSKQIHQRISLFGKDQFLFETRKVFDTGLQCRLWEDKVLRKMNVVNDNRWINKSYGCVYEQRKGIAGKKMVFIINDNKYCYMDKDLAYLAEVEGLVIIRGPKKPEHGKKVSLKMKGKPKSNAHKENRRISFKNNPKNRGYKIYNNGLRDIHIKSCDIIPDGFVLGTAKQGKSLPNKNKGKSYEEIYSIERSDELRKNKSEFFIKNNPSQHLKGKSYEEIYGKDKAKQLKDKRSINGKLNSKIYNVYFKNVWCFTGSRLEVEEHLYLHYKGARSNNIYNTKWLDLNEIQVHKQYKNR